MVKKNDKSSFYSINNVKTNKRKNKREKDKKFSITLAKSDDFDPEKYFDILDNNWKLDKFPEKISEAHLMCTGKPDKVIQG